MFADALQSLLPGTFIHLLVKQSEEWLVSDKAWTAMEGTERIPSVPRATKDAHKGIVVIWDMLHGCGGLLSSGMSMRRLCEGASLPKF